jgi:hypothetical protein
MDKINGTAGVMAVPDMEAGQGAVGCVVWWRMVGELDVARMRAAWTSTELPEGWQLDHPSDKVAFSRSLHHHFDRLVRLKGDWEWGVVSEQVEGDEYSGSLATRFRLIEAGIEQEDGPALDAGKYQEIVSSFLYFRSHVIQYDVSVWLCKMMERLGAVSLRDTGGVYFVPAHAVEQWEWIVAVLRGSSGHVLSYVPAMRSGEALDAIIDAVTQETAKLAERLAACASDKELGPKALRSRAADARAQAKKLHEYEQLVGRKVEGLGEQLASLEAMLAAAALAAMAQEEAAQAAAAQ